MPVVDDNCAIIAMILKTEEVSNTYIVFETTIEVFGFSFDLL